MAIDMHNAAFNISSGLSDIINRNIQKMQQREQLKSLLSQQQPGSNTIEDLLSQGGVTLNSNQSVNAADFLTQRPRNLVEQSVGKTPLSLQSMFKQPTAQPAVRKSELPEVRQAAQVPSEPDRSWETPAIRARRELEEIKGKNAKQARVDKETFPYFKKIKDQYATTSEVDARLDEMEDLLNSGNVQEGTFIKSIDALSQVPYIGKLAGAIEQAFLTNESQVFKKLSIDFLRDAKPYFGNNLSTREVELFLERVPSLMLSNEGNRAVIRNFRAINDYIKATDKVMEGIIAENGGERPRHLESQVQSRLKPAAENLRKAFRDSAKLIPKRSVKKREQEKLSPKERYAQRFASRNA